MDEFMKLMEAAYATGQSAEREACAQVAEDRFFGNQIAAAIRARGQA